MYKTNKLPTTSLAINTSYKGETIEEKIQRIVENKEPITDGAPIVYTDRSEGVKPEYNIKTDRWDIALDAMDAVTRTHRAKREERIKEKEDKKAAAKTKENPETGANTNDAS